MRFPRPWHAERERQHLGVSRRQFAAEVELVGLGIEHVEAEVQDAIFKAKCIGGRERRAANHGAARHEREGNQAGRRRRDFVGEPAT